LVCGYYNAKNSFGGYTGQKPFMAVGGLAIIQSDFGEPTFTQQWAARCG
jgi:hypothetical protein